MNTSTCVGRTEEYAANFFYRGHSNNSSRYNRDGGSIVSDLKEVIKPKLTGFFQETERGLFCYKPL